MESVKIHSISDDFRETQNYFEMKYLKNIKAIFRHV